MNLLVRQCTWKAELNCVLEYVYPLLTQKSNLALSALFIRTLPSLVLSQPSAAHIDLFVCGHSFGSMFTRKRFNVLFTSSFETKTVVCLALIAAWQEMSPSEPCPVYLGACTNPYVTSA